MKRRDFLTLMIVATSATALFAKQQEEWIWIEEVYKTLFPKTKTMPSAKEFGATRYLYKNIHHKTFDKDDADFILQGARDFKKAYPNFLHVKDKTSILEELKTNNYGYSWLDTLVYYGVEAMMSDPIYGGNRNLAGWKSVAHAGGIPAPKLRYIKGYDAL